MPFGHTRQTAALAAGIGCELRRRGFIFLANLDFAGLFDYALKALIGGGIWLGYKMTADYIDRKRSKAK